MRLVADIEANGLLDTVDTFHCMAAKDIDSNELYFTIDIVECIELLERADEVFMHAGIAYDKPALEKLHGLELDINITDTLVMSRLLYPDRQGGHGVEAWGKKLGRSKVENEDWSVYTEHMGHRCREDVEIQHLILLELWKEMEGFDWSESLELEHKVATIISQQERNGFYLDQPLAHEVIDFITSKIIEIESTISLPSKPKPFGVTVKEPFKINGHLKKIVLDWYSYLSSDDCSIEHRIEGPFTRVNWHVLKLSSHEQVKKYLREEGWIPTVWNTKDGVETSPKITQEDLDNLPTHLLEFGKVYSERTKIAHKKSQVQGWIKNVREDGRIGCGANPCGTPTGRMKHHRVANVPKCNVIFGKQMRSMFTVEEGRKLVGMDAAQLELRMLAHYINDEEYTKEILSGDIHTYNQRAAGLPNRDAAKTFVYAFNYGAGDDKIGSIVGGTARDGARIRKKFLQRNPKLKALVSRVKKKSRRGFLIGLDGRKIMMRRSPWDNRIEEHKALNTLLQCAGAVIMKKAMVLLDGWVREESLDVMKVLDMHDESQLDVLDKDTKRVKELCELSIVKAGEHFNLNIPLAGDVKININWSLTH